MHIMLYDDLISGANGTRQDYHDANLFAAGTSSPILDLLNVRYLIVPANVGPGRPDLLHLNQRMPTVYLDGEVRILENTDALPRAWIVHNTQDVGIGEAIPLLASGAIDPRQVALFEGEAPALPPANGSADVATVIQSGSSGMSIKTQTRVDSLLMLSEIAYPAWHAYVDGEQVPLLTADHALRAIPIPAGEHIVELRYESTSLRVGIAITTISYAALVAILVCALVLVRRRPRSPQFAHHRLRRLRI